MCCKHDMIHVILILAQKKKKIMLTNVNDNLFKKV